MLTRITNLDEPRYGAGTGGWIVPIPNCRLPSVLRLGRPLLEQHLRIWQSDLTNCISGRGRRHDT